MGVGLEFGNDQVSSDFVGQLDNGNIYHFDNRSLIVPNQGVPASFALETDTAWIYFRTDKNIELAGFRLTWSSTGNILALFPFQSVCFARSINVHARRSWFNI